MTIYPHLKIEMWGIRFFELGRISADRRECLLEWRRVLHFCPAYDCLNDRVPDEWLLQSAYVRLVAAIPFPV